jgi:hypothetical protein
LRQAVVEEGAAAAMQLVALAWEPDAAAGLVQERVRDRHLHNASGCRR